jgi:hypothetical protein
MKRWITFVAALGLLLTTAYAQKKQLRNVSFEINQDFILTTAQVGEIEGNFILDTGSPCIVLNSCYFHADEASEKGEGVTGVVDLQLVKIKSFQWGNYELRRVQLYALDMSHLEELLGVEIAGLLGYEALENQQLYIDYQTGEVSLMSAKQVELLGSPAITARIFSNNDLPCISIDIEGTSLNVGIDSGSLSNFLDEKAGLGLLSNQSQTDNIYMVRGLNQERKRVSSHSWDQLHISGRSIPVEMEYLVVSLEAHSEDQSLNGLLGVPFLKQGVFLIDFRKDELSIWPHDFAIN